MKRVLQGIGHIPLCFSPPEGYKPNQLLTVINTEPQKGNAPTITTGSVQTPATEKLLIMEARVLERIEKKAYRSYYDQKPNVPSGRHKWTPGLAGSKGATVPLAITV